MGLTKRKDGYYVEFPVIDDGKVLTLARGTPGAKLKRWKTGTNNKTMAKEHASSILDDLRNKRVVSERLQGPMTFGFLVMEYLADPKIQRQAIYQKKCSWVTRRFLPFFGNSTPIDAITTDQIVSYIEKRRLEPGRNGLTTRTATLNRELAGIKHIFSWAISKKKGDLKLNPAEALGQEEEDNVRDEILDPEQFDLLQACSQDHLQAINLVAYLTGMRRGEILGLTWDRVDLKRGFIRLKRADTKTKEGRIIPLSLSPELTHLFRRLQKVRALHDARVFLHNGKPIRCIKDAFRRACHKAGIKDFRFHDFRHTAVTNMRRAGIDRLTIMQISGHKTMVCFERYNSFREDDLNKAASQINTYLTLAHQNTPTSQSRLQTVNHLTS